MSIFCLKGFSSPKAFLATQNMPALLKMPKSDLVSLADPTGAKAAQGDILAHIAPNWRSSLQWKVPWRLSDVTHLAQNVFNSFPQSVQRHVLSGQHGGGRLIKLKEVGFPSELDLRKYRLILTEICKTFAENVPSQYFLTDTLLELHRLFNEKLYKEGVEKGLMGEVLSIQEVAKLDSKDLKLLIGQLRYVFNERPESSRDPIIQESCLQSAIH